jgi:4-hydroxyphenylpyruvate dioxygenase
MIAWSIATVSMGGTLETKLAAAARAGFRAVEIFENDLTFFSGKPRDVRRMADDLGLAIVALQPLRDFEAMPEPQRSRNMERARRKFDLMSELGTNLLCVCSNVAEESIDDIGRAADDLGRLADEAHQRGFRIGYEALAWGRNVRDWTKAWTVIETADRPNLGIVLDSFHICVLKNPIEPIASLPAARIALVQVADAPSMLMDPMSLSRHHRCFPGQGEFPIGAFFDAVVRSGYRGHISLEIFNDQFRGAAANSIARDGMRSLQLAGETLNRQRMADGKAAIAGIPPLPPPPEVKGIEFVEFAGPGTDSERLREVLEGLGFSLAARHRSKEVLLFRQNDVNIVLNRDNEGFAHSFATVHGPAVCAVALRVDDADVAVERATALGSSTYSGRIGPGEAFIPALSGVEGSLLYFVGQKPGERSIWEQDFNLEATRSTGGLIDRIDHFSNVVRRSEFLSWVLFYKAVLGFVDEPQVELADPYGAFYSRAVRSPDMSVRIPLNIAEGGPTVVSRFIDVFGGAGVQQIAFSTHDIFAFVEGARARGVKFLTIPENYYDDLAARHDLPPDLLDSLRATGILYDRTKDGEFFHIYTATHEDRFFFEIVERRNYDLFGAVNTPVRLAAQVNAQNEERQIEQILDYDR